MDEGVPSPSGRKGTKEERKNGKKRKWNAGKIITINFFGNKI